MSVLSTKLQDTIEYPDSDGQLMADNTLQYDWIEKIKGNLEILFADNPDVFVAGDLLWYPVQGSNTIRQAPDALVAFGRPKGYRGSYQQWLEGDIAPQGVFEVLSRGNQPGAITKKALFYGRHGVQEYYIYNPYQFTLEVRLRRGGHLRSVQFESVFVSPLLGIRFVVQAGKDLEIYYPDGRPFLSMVELGRQAESERRLADVARQETQEARQEAEAARLRAEEAEAARLRAEEAEAQLAALKARLRELGSEIL